MKDPVPIDKAARPRGPRPESHHALVDRVASASAFQKSNRLRELLLFLCGHALSDPDTVIREQEIGIGVFGRAGYDTSQDTLVRVQVSQLRKKLQQHFDSEGRDEPVVIEIPKGSYTPVFRDREAVPLPAGLTWMPRLRAWVNPLTLLLAVLALAAAVSSVWLALRLANSARPPVAGFESRPAVDRLWQQMFGDGRPACLVPSDATLVVFQDLIGRQLGINEYRRGQFGRIADELIKDPEQRAAAKLLVGKPCTPLADAQLVGVVEALNAVHQVRTDVVFTRDFGPAYLESHNVILLGTRRANPWMELFEDQLNFRTRFQESPQAAFFDHRAPLPGEEATYAGVFGGGRPGYCRVAFLPNLTRNGTVLVISGTDMASTQAGGQFISGERWIQILRSKLGLAGAARFPYFEVLLKVEYPAARLPKFDIVAHRIPKV